jgi:hypothetical protein
MAESILKLNLIGVEEANNKISALSKTIVEQKQRQKELREEIAKLAKRRKEKNDLTEKEEAQLRSLTIEQEKNNASLRENNKELKQNVRVVESQEGSLNQLRASLNALQTAYGKVNKETDEGAKQAAEMSEEIERLTLEVKAQEKAIGDTRRNVGNYEEAIQSALGSMGPLGAKIQTVVTNISQYNTQINQATQNTTNVAGAAPQATNAFKSIGSAIAGAVRSAMAFIATPIGAAITALAGIGLAAIEVAKFNKELRQANQELAGLTGQAGATLDAIRVKATALNETLGISVEDTAKAAKAIVNEFGVSYEEAMQKIETSVLATNGANDELLDSIKEYSTFFAAAGFSVEEFTGIVNAGFDLGIYSDKLPDALKEADISLKEQTKATRDALINAFGEGFTARILSKVNEGSMSTKEALQSIAAEAEKTGLSAEQAATLTADVFRGAGEDVGGAVAIFDALQVGISGSANELDEYGKEIEKTVKQKEELAAARQRAFEDEGFQKFMSFMRELGTVILVGVIEMLGTATQLVSGIVSLIPDLVRGVAKILDDDFSFFGGKDAAEEGKKVAIEYTNAVGSTAKAKLKGINKEVNEALAIDRAELSAIRGTFEDGLGELEDLASIAGKGAGAEFSGNFEDAVAKAFERSQSLLQFQFEVESEYIRRQQTRLNTAIAEATQIATDEFYRQNEAQIANEVSLGAQQQTMENIQANANGLQTSFDYMETSMGQQVDDLSQIVDFTGMVQENIQGQLQTYLDENEALKNLRAQEEALNTELEEVTINLEEQTELAEIYRDLASEGADNVSRGSRSSGDAARAEKDRLRIAQEIYKLGLTQAELLEYEKDQTLARLGLVQTEGETLEAFYTRIGETGIKAIDALTNKFLDGMDKLQDEALAENAAQVNKTIQELERVNRVNLNGINERMNAELVALMQEKDFALKTEEDKEKAKEEIRERFRREELLAQQGHLNALLKQYEDILLDDAFQESEGLDLISDEEALRIQEQISNIKTQIGALGVELLELGTDEETGEKVGALASALGLDPKGQVRLNLAVDAINQSFAVIDEAISVRAERRLKELEAQKEAGVITTEEFEQKRRQVEYEAALAGHRTQIVNAINTATMAALNAYASTLAIPLVGPALAPAAAAVAGAFGAAQVGLIAANKPKFSEGGILNGPSHANGGIQMFGKGGYFGEAEGGEAILTKGVMQNPALASMASAINVAAGGRPLFQDGGVIKPMQPATASDNISNLLNTVTERQPVLVVETLNQRQQSVQVTESLRTI